MSFHKRGAMDWGLGWLVRRLGRAALLGWLLLSLGPALAHQSGKSYLTVTEQPQGLEIRLDFPLKDLGVLLQLPSELAGVVDADQLAQLKEPLSQVVQQSLRLAVDGQTLPLVLRSQSVALHSDGLYVRQMYGAPLLTDSQRDLVIDYDFFKRGDRLARAYGKLVLGGHETSTVFDARHSVQRFALRESSSWEVLLLFFQEGVMHIAAGLDHLLFLLCLLLPGLLLVRYEQATPWLAVREPVFFALKVVTAFTLAHSITLTAAALDWVDLPDPLIESAIALSIMISALINLLLPGHRYSWKLAFGFGLVHGLGFANGLRSLGLAPQYFLESVLAFNLGVEAGQLVLVVLASALLLPWLRQQALRQRVLQWGSVVALLAACGWLLERLPG